MRDDIRNVPIGTISLRMTFSRNVQPFFPFLAYSMTKGILTKRRSEMYNSKSRGITADAKLYILVHPLLSFSRTDDNHMFFKPPSSMKPSSIANTHLDFSSSLRAANNQLPPRAYTANTFLLAPLPPSPFKSLCTGGSTSILALRRLIVAVSLPLGTA